MRTYIPDTNHCIPIGTIVAPTDWIYVKLSG
jgi:hypothetical protein